MLKLKVRGTGNRLVIKERKKVFVVKGKNLDYYLSIRTFLHLGFMYFHLINI